MKLDLLDVVETVPLEYAYNLAAEGPTAYETVYLAELKEVITKVLASLTPREERVIRRRFGIGVEESTGEEIAKEFSVTRGRIYGIESKALRKLKHPSRSMKILGV